MCNLQEFFELLEEFAPLKYSRMMIERGSYDNSGILIKNTESVKKVLFSLDLTETAVNKGIANGCDTIVTHHPAIYNPVKSLDVENKSDAPIIKAIKKGMNVS